MEWFTVPNLINAVIALGIFAVNSNLSAIKAEIKEAKEAAKAAHQRIDAILMK